MFTLRVAKGITSHDIASRSRSFAAGASKERINPKNKTIDIVATATMKASTRQLKEIRAGQPHHFDVQLYYNTAQAKSAKVVRLYSVSDVVTSHLHRKP